MGDGRVHRKMHMVFLCLRFLKDKKIFLDKQASMPHNGSDRRGDVGQTLGGNPEPQGG